MANVSKAATVITYTDKELEAIKILNENKGQKLSAKELGISTGTLVSLGKKAVDERPMGEGFERFTFNKEDYEAVCPTCGAKIAHKVYWVD